MWRMESTTEMGTLNCLVCLHSGLAAKDVCALEPVVSPLRSTSHLREERVSLEVLLY